jgi:hypothetical protein
MKVVDIRVTGLPDYFVLLSVKMKSSSIVVLRAFAISWASFKEGLYFPFSRYTMVSLRTLTILARSSWVRSYRALNSLIFVLKDTFIFLLSPSRIFLRIWKMWRSGVPRSPQRHRCRWKRPGTGQLEWWTRQKPGSKRQRRSFQLYRC